MELAISQLVNLMKFTSFAEFTGETLTYFM